MEDQIQNDVPRFAPVCQVCKAQNETLRAVTFPFVFSVVFMTYRRAFSGIYCKKHRRLYHLLASAITAIFGWIGIPFGLVYTPLTLVNLARGGLMSAQSNFNLLLELADKKLHDGDTVGAIRCLEESLRFVDDPQVRQRLLNLYQVNRSAVNLEPAGFVRQTWGIFVTLFMAGLLGLFTGLFDALVSDFLSPVIGSTDSIFVAILSWAPFVLMLFFSGIALQSLVGAHLTKNKLASPLLAGSLSILSGLVFLYNILEAQAILRNIGNFVSTFSFSGKDGAFFLRSILSSGAFYLVFNNLSYSQVVGGIYLVLVLAGAGLGIYASLNKGLAVSKWQERLGQVRGMLETREESSTLASWGALAGMFVVPVLFLMLLIPGKVTNVENAMNLMNMGLGLEKQYQEDAALAKFDQALQLWPDSVSIRINQGIGQLRAGNYDAAYDEAYQALEIDPQSMAANLAVGLVQVGRGEYDKAIEYIETASAIQPSWAAPHAILAVLHYQMDDVGLAEEEAQAAISHGENDSQANGYLAVYFMYMNDFETAEKYVLQAIKVGTNASDYITLAQVYAAEKKDAQARNAILEAERLGVEPSTVFDARATLAHNRGDLEEAESILLKGIEADPNQSTLFSDLSAVHLDMGQVSKAVEEAQKALKLNRYDGYAYIEFAFAYQAQGKTTEALEAARTGLQFHPKYDRVHYILGLCYMDSGMKAEAIKEFETFLDLYWERDTMLEEKALAEKYLQQLK